MASTSSPWRFTHFLQSVAVTLALGGAAGAAALGIWSATADDPSRAWQEARNVNSFFEQVSGAALESQDNSDILAHDLHLLLREVPESKRAAVLAEWEAPLSPSGYSFYSGATEQLNENVFEDPYDQGGLTGPFQTRVLAAAAGDLEAVRLELGEKPEGGGGPDGAPWLWMLLGVSTGAFVVGLLRDNDTGRLRWRLDGRATGAKITTGLLVPHIVGVALLTDVARQAITPMIRGGRRTMAGRAERQQVKLELMRAQTRALNSGPSLPDSPVADEYIQAQRNLERLEAITPRSPGVEAATSRARAVLAALGSLPHELSVTEAEEIAAQIAHESETLLDARSATIAGVAQAKAAGRVRA